MSCVSYSAHAPNPLATFPRYFPLNGEVANLLATRQTILTCQDVAKKSATTWQQVIVMEFGKRCDTTDLTDFYPRQLLIDLLQTCCGEVTNLLQTCCYRKTGVI